MSKIELLFQDVNDKYGHSRYRILLVDIFSSQAKVFAGFIITPFSGKYERTGASLKLLIHIATMITKHFDRPMASTLYCLEKWRVLPVLLVSVIEYSGTSFYKQFGHFLVVSLDTLRNRALPIICALVQVSSSFNDPLAHSEKLLVCGCHDQSGETSRHAVIEWVTGFHQELGDVVMLSLDGYMESV